MRFVPLGVRGSTPAPGAEYVRYGGHTSCVAVFGDADDAPHLVLDAGTGLSTLPALLGGRPFDGRIVLSHLHWDHVQGLPFCRSVDDPHARVTLDIPVQDDGTDPQALLARGLSPPHFPIAPNGLLGEWHFRALLAGAADEAVTVAPVAHKGGVALGIRVALDGASLAYLPDHALNRSTSATARVEAERFVTGADLLLHDGQFTAAEEQVARAYGHSTIEHALTFADRCAVGSLVLTHHAPTRTDDALDELAARFARTPGGQPVAFATQGAPIQVRSQWPTTDTGSSATAQNR